MKILFISYQFYPVVGGIPYISEYLAKYLNKKNNEIRCSRYLYIKIFKSATY